MDFIAGLNNRPYGYKAWSGRADERDDGDEETGDY